MILSCQNYFNFFPTYMQFGVNTSGANIGQKNPHMEMTFAWLGISPPHGQSRTGSRVLEGLGMKCRHGRDDSSCLFQLVDDDVCLTSSTSFFRVILHEWPMGFFFLSKMLWSVLIEWNITCLHPTTKAICTGIFFLCVCVWIGMTSKAIF